MAYANRHQTNTGRVIDFVENAHNIACSDDKRPREYALDSDDSFAAVFELCTGKITSLLEAVLASWDAELADTLEDQSAQVKVESPARADVSDAGKVSFTIGSLITTV